MHGIEICDDPFDPNRKIGIKDPVNDIEIPMEFGNSFVYLTTQAPTLEEIHNIPPIEMTSDAPWNPLKVGRRQLLWEEEEQQALISSISINEYTTSRTRPEEPQLHMDECKYDILLASCSPVYSERTLMQRLIASVKVARCYNNKASEEGKTNKKEDTVLAVDTRARHTKLSVEEVSRKFGVGLETARKTLKATTQYGIQHAVHPLSRRYRTDIMQSKRQRLNDTFYTDTMFSGIRSLRGNTCAQVFTNGKYVHMEPGERKSQAGEALGSMIDKVRIPDKIVFDGAKEQTGRKSEFMRLVQKNRIAHWQTEPFSPWQNRAKDQIREIRRRWRLLRQRKKVPSRLWDYAMVHVTKLMNFTAQGQNGRTGHEEVTGETPDISEYVDFDFYDWVWYWDTPDKDNSPKIGRWLGPSHRIGAAMCYYILVQNGEVVSRSSVLHMTIVEMMKDDIKSKMESYDDEVNGRLRDEGFECRHEYENAFYIEDEDKAMEPEEPNEVEEADEYTPESYDEYVGAQVMIPRPDGRIQGRITKRAKLEDGNPTGRRNNNYLLDTRMYEVELADGTSEEYYANVIAENLFAQVDSKGNQYVLMKEISEHRKDDTAIPAADSWVTTPNGRKFRKKTTRGWHLLVEWKEGGSDWIPLKDLKESYPVEVAEYGKANKIEEEPAFAWWVNDLEETKSNHCKNKESILEDDAQIWHRTASLGTQ
jgi:hypothetical protein